MGYDRVRMSGLVFALFALALVSTMGMLWYRRIQAVAIPERRLPWVVTASAGLGLALLALVNGPGVVGGLAAGLSGLVAALFLLTSAIGPQKGGSGVLRVGEPLPDFTAPDDSGEPFALSSLSGRPVLLKFFRGHW